MASPSSDARPHVVVVGAGALGAFVGGMMARAGHRVTLLDAWAGHVDRIRAHGLEVADSSGEHTVQVNALHAGEASNLRANPVDVTFITPKLYDTAWCAALIAPYLAEEAPVVTMQNAFAEHDVAAVIGAERVLGCIASRVQVELVGPACVRRTNAPGGTAYTAFRLGEMHGRVTPRARAIAQLLSSVDSARVTSNLWGERWSKLVANGMTSALCAISGCSFRDMYKDTGICRVMVQLAAEAIVVGTRLGFAVEPVFGLDPEVHLRAARGDSAMLARFQQAMQGAQSDGIGGGRSGIAQDLAKGRRTEIDHINGYIAARAAEVGLSAPTHCAVVSLVHDIERGTAEAGPSLVDAAARAHHRS